MTALSAGPIAAIAIACSVLSAILAGGIAYWKASRRGPRNTDTPTEFVYYEMTRFLQRSMYLPASGELCPDIVHGINELVSCLKFTANVPVPPAFIAALKAAAPCDGVVGADWPLWEKLMTDTKGENFNNNRDTALSVIVAHWLVPKLQPDGDETMTLLPPDFVSLRKRIMAEPQYDRRRRAVQQFWSFMTMCLQHNKNVNYVDAWDMPTPPDCRTAGAMRVREALFRLLEQYIIPQQQDIFERTLDRVIAQATVLATTLLCAYEGEAEFYWADPKTQPWPRAEKRLKDDDYFLLRWPGIREPIGHLGDELDSPNPEPQRRGLLPPPKRDWIRLPMDDSQRPMPALSSLGGRLLSPRLV